MPQARDEAGNIWETDAQGNPVRLLQPAGGGRQATIIANPYRQREELRKEEDQGFQREQIRLAQENAARSEQARREAEARADRKEEADRKALEARGGVDTTEAERTAAFLATRVAGGLQDLQRIGKIGAPSLKDALIGGTLLGNYVTEENRQRTINAQRDILDAALTLGTGAAYTQEQIDSYRASHFPVPGESEASMADKSQRLQRLLNAAKVKAGAAASQIDTALGDVVAQDAQSAFKQGATREQIDAIAARYGRQPFGPELDEAIRLRPQGGQAQFRPDENGSYNDSLLSQGLSGANEGLSSTLGLPVDLVNSALGLGAQGINAIANTDLAVSENPFLGSDWWNNLLTNAGSIGAEGGGDSGAFARRVGQSVGANAIPMAAGARTGGQAAASILSSLGGGTGAAIAQQVAPGNPWAEMGGELIGGGIPGAASIGRGRNLAQREIESAIPTVPQLKQQAGDLYTQAEANGITANPVQTKGLSDNIAAILAKEGVVSPTGRISEVHPKVKEAQQLIRDYAGQDMNPTQMQTVRSVLSDASRSADPAEGRIARLLLNEFDDFTTPLAPELADARSVASRYLQAQDLELAKELAGVRAGQFTGSGFENALRTEYRGIDRNIAKGRTQFNPAVEEQVRTVDRGTPASNAARWLGKAAPTGVVSGSLGAGVPFMIGNAIGGPVVGAVAAGSTLGLGGAGRKIATDMGIRNADIAELLARNGGAIPQAQAITPDIERLIALGLLGQQGQYLDGGGNVQ